MLRAAVPAVPAGERRGRVQAGGGARGAAGLPAGAVTRAAAAVASARGRRAPRAARAARVARAPRAPRPLPRRPPLQLERPVYDSRRELRATIVRYRSAVHELRSVNTTSVYIIRNVAVYRISSRIVLPLKKRVQIAFLLRNNKLPRKS